MGTRRRCYILVAFEGPDWYGWRGGLAERAVALATHLADRGAETHYYFFGDPELPGEERLGNVPLVLHRWAQWLCAGLPGGAYDGEDAKSSELARTLPDRLLTEIILPALALEVTPVVLAEEWQTVPCLLALAERLDALGLRDRVQVLWRIGSLVGTDRIDWGPLGRVAQITVTTAGLQAALSERGIEAMVLSSQPASLTALLEDHPVAGRRPDRDGPGVSAPIDRPYLRSPQPRRTQTADR